MNLMKTMKTKYTLKYSAAFLKSLDKLTKKEQGALFKKLELLKVDPFYPSLRSKPMKGRHGVYESSVNMDIRILWRYEGNVIILLADVGHHDILDRF